MDRRSFLRRLGTLVVAAAAGHEKPKFDDTFDPAGPEAFITCDFGNGFREGDLIEIIGCGSISTHRVVNAYDYGMVTEPLGRSVMEHALLLNDPQWYDMNVVADTSHRLADVVRGSA